MQTTEVEIVGNIQPENPHQSGNVYGVGGVSPNIMAGTHGYGFGYIIEVIEIEKTDTDL